jgi:hypothetical protein
MSVKIHVPRAALFVLVVRRGKIHVTLTVWGRTLLFYRRGYEEAGA